MVPLVSLVSWGFSDKLSRACGRVSTGVDASVRAGGRPAGGSLRKRPRRRSLRRHRRSSTPSTPLPGRIASPPWAAFARRWSWTLRPILYPAAALMRPRLRKAKRPRRWAGAFGVRV